MAILAEEGELVGAGDFGAGFFIGEGGWLGAVAELSDWAVGAVG